MSSFRQCRCFGSKTLVQHMGTSADRLDHTDRSTEPSPRFFTKITQAIIDRGIDPDVDRHFANQRVVMTNSVQHIERYMKYFSLRRGQHCGQQAPGRAKLKLARREIVQRQAKRPKRRRAHFQAMCGLRSRLMIIPCLILFHGLPPYQPPVAP